MKYNDKQINILLDNIVVVVDTREQENSHIIDGLKKNNKKYIWEKVDQGDYSCYIESNSETIPLGILENYYIKDLIVERKGSVNELISNFVERRRIENELIRFKENGIKPVLLIEDPEGFRKIMRGEFRSRMKRESAIGTYFSFIDRYNITPCFIGKAFSALFIYSTLRYHAREVLKGV